MYNVKKGWEKGMNEMHQCYWCDSSFFDILDLIAHLKENHPTNGIANSKRIKL